MDLGRLAITLPVPFASAPECVELARRAETEWGYDAIWLAETGGAESFALAAAIAHATERITLGTAIVPVFNRTPAVLAMAAGTVAQLSGGRFILGLGSSSHAMIERWNGVRFERPLTRVRETVEVVRAALSGAKTDFQGATLQSRGFRLGCLPERPVPIYLAALREKMLRLDNARPVDQRVDARKPQDLRLSPRCRRACQSWAAFGKLRIDFSPDPPRFIVELDFLNPPPESDGLLQLFLEGNQLR